VYERVHFESLRQDPDEVVRFLWENRATLGLYPGTYTRVMSVRPCVRVAPDGFVLRETVAEWEQMMDVRAAELRRLGLRAPKGMSPRTRIRLHGGGTLIFDEFGKLKFNIHKRLIGRGQQQKLDYLWAHGGYREDLAQSRALAFGGYFAHLHRQRALFGSFPKPKGARKGFMEQIAQDITTRCQGGRLAVVATHRHADHINGFTTSAGGTASGDIIRALKPDVVIQPWTEHPDAARDAHTPALRPAALDFHESLAAMQGFAAALVPRPGRRRPVPPRAATYAGGLPRARHVVHRPNAAGVRRRAARHRDRAGRRHEQHERHPAVRRVGAEAPVPGRRTLR
jgi:hypothetical protein